MRLAASAEYMTVMWSSRDLAHAHARAALEIAVGLVLDELLHSGELRGELATTLAGAIGVAADQMKKRVGGENGPASSPPPEIGITAAMPGSLCA